ncbi:MAG: transcription initiation factor IIB [Phylliscum demangeonii]|nr:MAG: transcription initiation factor IIB [Phylliscum demangeonii]
MSSPLFIRLQVEKALLQSLFAELFDDGPQFDDAAAVERKQMKEQEMMRQAKQEKKLRHRESKRRRRLVARAANQRYAQPQWVLQTTLLNVGTGPGPATEASVGSATAYVPTKSTHQQQPWDRFGSQLGLDAACTKVSQELAKRMARVGGKAGRRPQPAAAACIYMASHLLKQAKTAQEIAAVVGVSKATIRTGYKFLYHQRHHLIDDEWHKDGKGDIGALPST